MYGMKFKLIRSHLGLKQKELAGLLEVTPAALSKIEHDINDPGSTINLNLIAKCNINLNWLYANHGSMFLDRNTRMKAGKEY